MSEASGRRCCEMAHAATQGIHRKAWQREMRCLKRLGAPVAPEDLDARSANSRVDLLEMLDTFEEYGWEEPETPWKDLLRRLAYPMRLVTKDGKAVSKRAERFLLRCRRAFNRGARHWKKG